MVSCDPNSYALIPLDVWYRFIGIGFFMCVAYLVFLFITEVWLASYRETE